MLIAYFVHNFDLNLLTIQMPNEFKSMCSKYFYSLISWEDATLIFYAKGDRDVKRLGNPDLNTI
jgi:hypothetical protein